MATSSQSLHTTVFKAWNFSIEGESIQLSEFSWIERSNNFVGEPKNFHPSLLAFDLCSDPRFGLSNYYKELLCSPIRLRVISSEEDREKNPFQIHDCSYIAIAIAIFCDPWFVVGIEHSYPSNQNSIQTAPSPSMSFFAGHNSSKPFQILKSDYKILSQIYDFIYQTLAYSTWDSDEAKLLFLFLKCVTMNNYQRFNVLKLSLDHLFTEWDSLILNAALFFEFLFTKESRNHEKGVQVWNQNFPIAAKVDEQLVEIIFQYRHIVAHSNPTKAKSKITAWKKQSGLDNQAAAQKVRKELWSTAKMCLRAVIMNQNEYCIFRQTKPN